MKHTRTVLIFFFITVMHGLLFTQMPTTTTGADSAFAYEEFRRGVQSYYRGSFNDAIMLFEKALSWLPKEPLIIDWLGKSYYKSGSEGAALQQWSFAQEAGYESTLLKARMEVVNERRILKAPFEQTTRYVESNKIEARYLDSILFNQPVSIAPSSDGSFWVLAYGSNELLHFDVNGVILTRHRGPIGGFDRPLDLYPLADGRMLVTEVAADRVSIVSSAGTWLRSFGKTGRGIGELLGPQYIATDEHHNIYVSDYGNARVVVFDPEGKGLFSFGEKSLRFKGFKSPTGIAIIEDRVFIADSITGELFVFNTFGEYIEVLLPSGSIIGCESIRVLEEYLIVSLPNRVMIVDVHTGASFDAAKLGNAPMRITNATPDINGNLLLSDYTGNSIQVVTKMNDLVGGMFLEIERVNSDNFPNIVLDVKVEDRNRNPIVGLKESNFYITEKARPVSKMKLTASGYLDDYCDVSILIDRSVSSAGYEKEIKDAITQIAQGMKGKGTLRIVSAGSIPVLEGSGSPETGNFEFLSLKAKPDLQWRFDLGLRLAVNDIIGSAKKKAVVFLSTGEVTDASFNLYGLNDLAAFMNNNTVSFYLVQLNTMSPAQEYSFLCKETKGRALYVYRNEGLMQLPQEILQSPNGLYTLSYTSHLQTDFGRSFLPVEVEAYLMKRSGRDETGYFAPLE